MKDKLPDREASFSSPTFSPIPVIKNPSPSFHRRLFIRIKSTKHCACDAMCTPIPQTVQRMNASYSTIYLVKAVAHQLIHCLLHRTTKMSDPNATLIECRVEYALGSVIIAARFFTRWKTLGWRGFYWDDFFAFWSWVFFTLIYVMVEYLSKSKIAVSSRFDRLTDNLQV